MAELVNLDGTIENISREQSLDMLSSYNTKGCGKVLAVARIRGILEIGYDPTCGATDPRQKCNALCVNCGGSWELKK